MVYDNGFSIEIIPVNGSVNEFNRTGAKYVGLNNNSEYKIKLINQRDTICDVDVDLEGRHIGRWRINAHDDIVIERPAKINQKFTFFSETNRHAIEAGVNIGGEQNGLLKATFYPKKPYREEPVMIPESVSYQSARSANVTSSIRRSSPRGFKSGVTLLGDYSDQQFDTTRRLRADEIDWSNKTTIYLRLVVRDAPRYRQIPYPPRIEDTYRSSYRQIGSYRY